MKTKSQIKAEGFEITFTNGTGAGGQKRNRTLSVAILKHLKSGIIERCDESRSATKNMNIAYKVIIDKLLDIKYTTWLNDLNEKRKLAAARGVIRTYDFKQGIVKNHITKKKAPLKKVLNGQINLIN